MNSISLQTPLSRMERRIAEALSGAIWAGSFFLLTRLLVWTAGSTA